MSACKTMLVQSRVFVADRDVGARKILASSLREAGYRVVEVGDARALLDSIASVVLFDRVDEEPQAIISDVRLLGASGIGALSALAIAGWSPCMILLANDRGAVGEELAGALGDATVFDKALPTARLVSMLERLVPPWVPTAIDA